MALSYVLYTGNGTTGPYNVTFSFLSRSHVTVKVAGVTAAFTWLSDSQIQLDSAAAQDAVIEIRRTTPRATPLTDFQDASTLSEADLDNNTAQLFYLAQEAIDDATNVAATADGKVTVNDKVIAGVANGVENDEAVNVSQLNAAIVSAGNVPNPANPADDFKALVAEGGSWSWAVTLGAFFRNTFAAVADAAAARTALGLGTIATQGAGAVAITGGTLDSVTITNSTLPTSTLEIGMVYDYAGSTLPDASKYAWCNGAALDSVADTTLATLYTRLGTAWGGTGAANFNLPDLRGRTTHGKDNMGGVAASRLTTGSGGVNGTLLGATGGTETKTLSVANMPPHTHDTDIAQLDNEVDVQNGFGNGFKTDSGGTRIVRTSTSVGSGSAFSVIGPTAVVNKIIRIRA